MSASVFYADTDLKIARVVTALDRAADRGEVAGLDTEFYGVDLRQKSVVGESKLHLISVAVLRSPRKLHPRGFSVADAAVLPASAIHTPGFRRWLSSEARKAVHNLPVDAHTLHNAGVVLGGGINTLAMARWAWPSRARAEGFTLDALGRDFCGVGKTESFKELFSEEVEVPVVRTRKVKVCACGEVPRKGHPRSNVFGHARREEVEILHDVRRERQDIPLESVTPGHRLWDRCLSYAAADAILALAVYELSQAETTRQTIDVPWYALPA